MAPLLTKTILENVRTGEKSSAAATLLELLRDQDFFQGRDPHPGMLTGMTFQRFKGQGREILAIAIFKNLNDIDFFCYADIRNDEEGWGFTFDRYDYINDRVKRENRKVKMAFYKTSDINLDKWKETYRFT